MKTNKESLEFCNYFYKQAKDNLFSANHRNAMLTRYNYTDALFVTVGELEGMEQ